MKYQHYKRSLLPTGKDILGPFYRPGSPFATNIMNNTGVPLSLSGTIRDTDGNPVACYLDFWQADENGRYDEEGPKQRGIQGCINGTYTLDTIKPGYYDISAPTDPQPHDFRCSHIHVKVWIGGVDVLTTQLYFADSEYDDTDHWFSKDRCIKMVTENQGIFDFVVSLKN